ncbi:IclR family transcriptional regulator [Cellulomonas aerilata]|uniref:IclR family transcriptional regulator n=1 Tax=Cellulomonas aerilata TaxID=515326 RepID=UPI0024829CFA|nr:IclR family transcriptional regulator [Cellulomonas aerilata]
MSRAVRVLSFLADSRGVPQPLTEIARAVGAAKSSTSNVCAVLEESGLVQRRGPGYVLGRRTVELGGAYLAGFDQVREFYRICAQSPVLSHELVQIAVLDGTDVLYLARHEGRAPLRLTAGIGDRFPAALTAVGNALLAELPAEEVDARYRRAPDFPRLTDRSTQTVERLQTKLAATRARGYALDEGEVFPNVVGLAVTVPARLSGEQTLALGVSTIDVGAGRVPAGEHRTTVLAALHEAAALLSNPMAVPVLRAGAGRPVAPTSPAG